MRRWLFPLALSVALSGCGSSEVASPGSGGNAATGGSGGSAATGGSAGSAATGGSGGSAATGGSAGSAATGGSAGSGGSAATGGGGTAAGGTAGAAGAGAAGAGGAAGSTPERVACGTDDCTAPDDYCCDASATPGDESCVPSTTSSCTGLRRFCDDATDCPTGNVCCTIPASATFYMYNTSCAPDCDTLFPQICKTSSECKNGQACVSQTCSGFQVQTCGPITGLTCQ